MSQSPPPPASPPQPPMMAYAPLDPRGVDASHLNALSICHFIWGGLLALIACFGLIYVALGVAFASGKIPMTPPPGATQPAVQPPDMRFIGIMFATIGSVITLAGWTLAACTVASGVCMRRRRKRMFSIVVAALNCALFPFGTTLGVFSLMVLVRESVRQMYEEPAAASR